MRVVFGGFFLGFFCWGGVSCSGKKVPFFQRTPPRAQGRIQDFATGGGARSKFYVFFMVRRRPTLTALRNLKFLSQLAGGGASPESAPLDPPLGPIDLL